MRLLCCSTLVMLLHLLLSESNRAMGISGQEYIGIKTWWTKLEEYISVLALLPAQMPTGFIWKCEYDSLNVSASMSVFFFWIAVIFWGEKEHLVHQKDSAIWSCRAVGCEFSPSHRESTDCPWVGSSGLQIYVCTWYQTGLMGRPCNKSSNKFQSFSLVKHKWAQK